MVRAQRAFVGLGPVGTEPPAVPIGVTPAQLEIVGAVAKRSGGAPQLLLQRGQTQDLRIGTGEQRVFFCGPWAPPAATIAELADGGAEGADRSEEHPSEL